MKYPLATRIGLRTICALAALAGAGGCSSGDANTRLPSLDASGGAASSARAGAGGTSAPSTAPRAGAGGSSNPNIVLDGLPTAGKPSMMNDACKAESREGKRVPIDMYFLVDSSGSMGDPVAGGTRWQVVSKALVAFLNDPKNGETGMGIGYYPKGLQATCVAGDPGCLCIPIINICLPTIGGSCTVSDYASPDVALALPPPLATIVSSINAHQVAGGTPTRPAVEGALQYLTTWAVAHPDRKPVLVLATDGDPTGCEPNSPQDIADLAASALAGPHAIQTFVIGVGRSLASLNLVAQAGGTERAFLVDTGGDVAREFTAALDEIRGTVNACDFSIPTDGPEGKSVNPNKVNVRFTAQGASSPTLVSQTFGSDPANCGTAGGWYYDNPQAPTLIKLCDATCQALGAGSIEVEFGCDTIVQPPR